MRRLAQGADARRVLHVDRGDRHVDRREQQVAATDTAEGRPIEPTPVKLLCSEAGPSTSDTRSLPTEEIAGEPYPPLEMRVFMSLTDSWSHFGSS